MIPFGDDSRFGGFSLERSGCRWSFVRYDARVILALELSFFRRRVRAQVLAATPRLTHCTCCNRALNALLLRLNRLRCLRKHASSDGLPRVSCFSKTWLRPGDEIDSSAGLCHRDPLWLCARVAPLIGVLSSMSAGTCFFTQD